MQYLPEIKRNPKRKSPVEPLGCIKKPNSFFNYMQGHQYPQEALLRSVPPLTSYPYSEQWIMVGNKYSERIVLAKPSSNESSSSKAIAMALEKSPVFMPLISKYSEPYKWIMVKTHLGPVVLAKSVQKQSARIFPISVLPTPQAPVAYYSSFQQCTILNSNVVLRPGPLSSSPTNCLQGGMPNITKKNPPQQTVSSSKPSSNYSSKRRRYASIFDSSKTSLFRTRNSGAKAHREVVVEKTLNLSSPK